MKVLDILVVGAGPAGLAVALGAARAGLDVAVCEKRAGVVDKACGEGLMPGALQALHRLGVDPPGHDIAGIVYRQHEHVANARFPGGPGRGVRRTALQAALRAQVDAAGVPVIAQAVHHVSQHPTHVSAAGVHARYVVAADGLHSPLRTELGLAAGTRSQRRSAAPRWGQRRHFAVPPWSDSVEVTWARDAESYVTPVAQDVVGVAVLSGAQRGFDDHLRAFPELMERLGDATAVSSARGAGPLQQRVRTRVAGRVLLVGDAAGYVDALTGEGLALAFSTAEALVSCIVRDRPEDYDHAWRHLSRRSRWITSGLLWARRNPVLSQRIVPLAERAPSVFSFAVGQLAR